MIPDARLQEAMRRHQSGDLDGAAQLYSAMLQTQPRNFHALYLLGFLEFQRGDYLGAERLIGQAIAVTAASPDAFYKYGCALQTLNREADAVAAFDRALALKPDYAEAAFNRGTSLLKLGDPATALAAFDAALRLTPQDAEAWFNRGNALQGLKRFAEAGGSYERALGLNPNLAFAPGKLVYCKLQCCDWASLADLEAGIERGIRSGQPAAGPLEYALISSAPEDLLTSARIWVAHQCPPAPSRLWQGGPYDHPRIRIAYLSADFRAHAVAYQIVGLLEQHDRARFEVLGISYGRDDDSAIRHKLRSACDEFLDLSTTSDRDIAALLRARELDIAVDLTGHTADSRIGVLGYRPAPIQVNFLGFPGTSGAPYVDYIIGDRWVIPDGQRSAYSEAVVHLPDTFFPADGNRRIGALPPSRIAAGLPEHSFVFCSFNATCKISPPMFRLWLRLLAQVPDSVLWLPEPGAEARGNLQRETANAGIASERLVFAPFVPDAETHLGRLPLADLFLDSLPYNAHATACDALQMGLPVLTCTGSAFAGRVATSLLHAVDMPELVAPSLEAYEAGAIALARERSQLAALRARLSARRTTAPLFDTARYTRHLETAYSVMVERSRRGEPPKHLVVPARD
jgi:predicted O-linked N-acetylglucosamine transferase (SPINDLY family)